MKKRVYLAGPDVFYPGAREHGDCLKRACEKEGLEGLFPLDAEVPFALDRSEAELREWAGRIFRANVALIESADGVLANLQPFRGPSADVGTVWEVGYAAGRGKPVVGYTPDMGSYRSRVQGMRRLGHLHRDNLEVEDFGLVDNLMIDCSLAASFPTFAEAAVDLARRLGK